MAAVPAPADPESLRRQLAASARQLDTILDQHWKAFLALPPDVYSGNRPINVAALGQSLSRFESVAWNPQYQALTQRPEFSATHELLKRCVQTPPPSASPALSLPPPPAVPAAR